MTSIATHLTAFLREHLPRGHAAHTRVTRMPTHFNCCSASPPSGTIHRPQLSLWSNWTRLWFLRF